MSLRGRLYLYEFTANKNGEKVPPIEETIRESTLAYQEVTGHRPSTVYVKDADWEYEERDLVVPGDYVIDVVPLVKNGPPNCHFILTHEIVRNPRIVKKIKRRPIL